MAIIEFINRQNKSLDGMRKNLIYITKEEKTAQGKYIFGYNCDAKNAYEDFCLVKEIYHKNSGRQHIHFTQSFDGKEADPELAHKIGKKLLENEAFKGFQVVMTTHVDTYNTHNHFVINTVNAEDGKKWKLSQAELEELKDYSDEICMEYNLSVIDRTYKTSKEYVPAWKENSKQYETYLSVLNASKQAKSMDEFSKIIGLEGKILHLNAGEYFSKNQKLENILNACKYHAKDEQEFIDDCKKYGVTTSWKIKAVIEEKEAAENKKEEKIFDSMAEYKDFIENLVDNKEVVQVTDDIRYEYHGTVYTPAHFLKNMRYEGKMLREQFQVNLVKDSIKPLPAENELKQIKNSDEFKNMSKIIRTVRQCSLSKEDFISKMNLMGVKVTWTENRKYITFQSESGKKYRNNRFYPVGSYTKEAFEQVFSFNSKMLSIIKENGIASYEDLKALAQSNRIAGFRVCQESNRLYLKMEFSEEKNMDAKPALETVERESYFDEIAISRFFIDPGRKDIILPGKEEILEKEKRRLLFETKEGYLFSGSSLSKKFTEEKLQQRFYNNTFSAIRSEAAKDIRSILYLSTNFEDFAEKLGQAGYQVQYRALTEEDKMKCAMKETKKISGNPDLIFTSKNGIIFEGTFAAKGFTMEYITDFLEKNKERLSQQQREQNFNLFLKGLWIFGGDGDRQAEEINRRNIITKDLSKEALKEKWKERGYER